MFKIFTSKPKEENKFEKCMNCNNRLDELRQLKNKQKDMIDNPYGIKAFAKEFFPYWYKVDHPAFYHEERFRLERTLREIITDIENLDEFFDKLSMVKDFESDVKHNDKKINDLMIELGLR